MPPVGAAIAAVATAIGGAISAVSAFAASSFIGSLIVNTAITVGISLIARALTPKPKIQQSGIQTAVTTTGGTEPQGFILGRTATAGHHVCPPMSHDDGGTPNGFLTYVIELSDLPGIGLSRVILNDGYSSLAATAHPDYGFPLLGQRIGGKDHAWIKFYDGTQTAADPMLVSKYSSYSDRPWSSSFIGINTGYAVLTFRYNREVFNNLPTVRFELDGIPLYDPRFDSTVGGSGPQRWPNPATWTRSANPAVMIYNILRGIRLPTGEVWGGDVPAEDLPLDNWFAAMNACDLPIGSRPSFQAGLEIKLDMEPAEVIDELAKTCLGQVSEMGGVFRMRVGAPAAPVQFITDEDIVISEPQELEPFPGLAASANAISSEYPEPQSLWTSRAAPQVLNATWEAEDGGRRLPTSINFPACSNQSQVAHLMNAYIKDARRFRVHRLVLPPEAFMLEPLDTIAWTSEQNGYTNKVFELIEIIDQPGTVNQELILRERDPSDYGWTSADDLPAVIPVTGLAPRPAQIIEGWSVSASTIKDALGLDRRPAITLTWVGTSALDALLVRFEVRLKATAQIVSAGLADRAAGAVLVSEGLLPEAEYEVRGRYVLDRPTEWSSWLSVTTLAIFFSGEDLVGGIKGLMNDAGLSPVEILSSLPTSGNFAGRTVYLTTDQTLYTWSGAEWTSATASLAASDITGQLTSEQIASIDAAKVAGQLTDAQIASIGAAKIAGQLATAQIDNNAITDAKIAGMAATKISGQLTNTQINSLAAAKLTGQIASTQISDDAVTTPKIAAGAVTAGEIAAGAILADKIATNAVTAVKISAGAVEASKIAAAAIDANKIAAGAVTADKVAANAIAAGNIVSGAVTTQKLAAGAVTANTIATNAVTAAKISAGQVTTAKIAAGAVVADKIATNAVTADKISAGAITTNKIAANTITAGLIAAGAISAEKISADGLAADQIKAGTISVERLPGLTRIEYGSADTFAVPPGVYMNAVLPISNVIIGSKVLAIITFRPWIPHTTTLSLSARSVIEGLDPATVNSPPEFVKFVYNGSADGVGNDVIVFSGVATSNTLNLGLQFVVAWNGPEARVSGFNQTMLINQV